MSDAEVGIAVALITGMCTVFAAWLQERRKNRTRDEDWRETANELQRRLDAQHASIELQLQAQIEDRDRTLQQRDERIQELTNQLIRRSRNDRS